jgi:predicted transcriptional regulator
MPLGVYRGKFDIIADILSVASADAKKTQIMYKANLSYKVLQHYLAEVTEAALVSFHHEKGCYVLTEKGRLFLETYRDYHRTSKNVEKHLSYLQDKKMLLHKLLQNTSSQPQHA